MKETKFSVVIPVYNVKEFLEECILSVINQSYSNWEMILVDDGSTDNSFEICQKYSDIYDNILSIKSEHGGVSKSRNIALRKVTGNYVVFLDSDDYIKPGLFKYLNDEIQKHNPDCFIGNFETLYMSDKFKKITDKNLDATRINGRNQQQVLEYFYQLRLVFTLWRFVVKTEMIMKNNLFLVEGIIHEDEEWCTRMLLACEKYRKIEFAHYVYRKRENSIMTYEPYIHFKNYLKVIEHILDTASSQTVHYKKIFTQRCAYKCAGLIYYGLKDISEFMPPIKNIEEV